jgi:hypothetical protein
MHSGLQRSNLIAGRCFLEHLSREAVLFEAVLFRWRREEPAPEEGPDSLCRTRTTIQPERTMIRSNL